MHTLSFFISRRGERGVTWMWPWILPLETPAASSWKLTFSSSCKLFSPSCSGHQYSTIKVHDSTHWAHFSWTGSTANEKGREGMVRSAVWGARFRLLLSFVFSSSRRTDKIQPAKETVVLLRPPMHICMQKISLRILLLLSCYDSLLSMYIFLRLSVLSCLIRIKTACFYTWSLNTERKADAQVLTYSYKIHSLPPQLHFFIFIWRREATHDQKSRVQLNSNYGKSFLTTLIPFTCRSTICFPARYVTISKTC